MDGSKTTVTSSFFAHTDTANAGATTANPNSPISICFFIFRRSFCFIYRVRGTFCAGTDCFFYSFTPLTAPGTPTTLRVPRPTGRNCTSILPISHRRAILPPWGSAAQPEGGILVRSYYPTSGTPSIRLRFATPRLRPAGPPPRWGGINVHSPSQNGCALGKIKTNKLDIQGVRHDTNTGY